VWLRLGAVPARYAECTPVGRATPPARFAFRASRGPNVRTWRKLTCERQRGVRVMTLSGRTHGAYS
jgi:hypothetical protein